MHDVERWQHDHDFRDAQQHHYERRTHWVIALTAVTMVVELIAGTMTGSMALLADGWHMATHVGALSIAAYAYSLARRHATNPVFTFGTGKVASLGGYTSAVALGLVALLMAVESLYRLFEPHAVQFNEAMVVAWIGLAVNLLSAWLLGHGGAHDHHHGHGHGHHDPLHELSHRAHDDGEVNSHHHDHNLRGAYMHVLADALTSVLAIFALWTGARFGWVWMDPLMGLVGAVVIARWSIGLLQDTGRVLLDAEDNTSIKQTIRRRFESDSDLRIADLHVWRVGTSSFACIVSLVTHHPQDVEHYKQRLAGVAGLDHVTIEVIRCRPESCPMSDGDH